ncbi:spore coat protein [Clostridium sp. JN-9]|uniref:spore coat protein n=1 Tax=Clostridium sp. JN-9 TaxID=2507159 RepID=UPI000FFE2971|nr:spore coat protein [Clostridium sp. JN-9]QAT39716.1 spore coat protein [Clostridium sp. JN-9]
MNLQLSQKERMFLEDAKIQEEVCIEKYNNYSGQTQDPQLKQLFNRLSGEEQHHHDIVNQMLQGQQPNLSHAGLNLQSQQGTAQQNTSQGTAGTQQGNQRDKMLCTDLLSTEKYVSGTYDSDVFESASPAVRQAMQHIQQEEQKHGEELFNYMNSHGMYNVK